MSTLASFLASRKAENKPVRDKNVHDHSAPIVAEILADPDFRVDKISEIAGPALQYLLNERHNHTAKTDEAAKVRFAAMYAMLAWLSEADTNHVRVDGKEFRLTLVPTEPPHASLETPAGKHGNPAGAK